MIDSATPERRPAKYFLTGAMMIAITVCAATLRASTPAVFAGDCTTAKATFNLGDTVCAVVTGAQGLRLQWVDADGYVVNTSNITSDPQTFTLVLPNTHQSLIAGLVPANNLGGWRVNVITSRGSINGAVPFTLKDPAHPTADLSIVKSMVGSTFPNPGDSIQFAVRIVNNGPDDAANAHFVDNTFTAVIFNSMTQTSGPTFTCSGSGADCTIASFPNGAVAEFLLNFTVSGAGGVISNTATISSDTDELNPNDNSSSTAPTTATSSTPPPTCTPSVTAPPAVTLFTGAGATSCGVTVADLDATLGTATATDNCQIVGGIDRSGVPAGNVFPVGTTTVTYSITDIFDNGASANQTVTVIDNTMPVIACPSDITLEPTCPTGAVATWTPPVGTDNCPNSTTAQTAGGAPGTVFPIGTTAVAYTVTDASGNQASCGFNVTVLTVQATLQKLEASINASTLNGPQQQGLLPKLDSVLDALNRGNKNAACGPLNAFVNAVQSLMSDGTITAAQGQEWITSATHVRNAIGCTNNPCS